MDTVSCTLRSETCMDAMVVEAYLMDSVNRQR